MQTSCTYRILFLLKLLSEKDYTKKELLAEFKKNDIKISNSSINSYINKLKLNDININISKKKNENVYHFKRKPTQFELTEAEIAIIHDIKKLLFAQKNYNKIRKVVRLFCKIIFAAKGDELKSDLLNFDYYSSLNWLLVRTLENHCKNKDIILIDYILPEGKNKKIKIHADDLRIGDWSNRLYLWGSIDKSKYLSYIPVDKIFMIEKIIQKNVPFEVSKDILTYHISKNLYEEISLDKKEKLISLDKKIAIIERPLEDNFFIIQRLMSFCPDLYYISDEKIKNKVKEKLEILKASYEKEYE